MCSVGSVMESLIGSVSLFSKNKSSTSSVSALLNGKNQVASTIESNVSRSTVEDKDLFH